MRNDGKVVCSHAKSCHFHKEDVARGFGCGGAKPHDPRGCDPCPVHDDVKCVPVCQAVCSRDCDSPATHERQNEGITEEWHLVCAEHAGRYAKLGYTIRKMEAEMSDASPGKRLVEMETAENARVEADLEALSCPPTVGLADAAASMHRLLDIAKGNGLKIMANNGKDQEWIEIENVTVRRSE